MAQVYIISDPHFGHKNIITRYRNFSTTEEHDELIVSNWNSVVTKRDIVIIAGDVTMENSDYSILGRLNGIKRVIGGNHDLPKHSKELMKYVDSISGAYEYKGCIITHIPIHTGEVDRFRVNLHGHTHSWVIEDARYVNVCVDVQDYKPRLISDIINCPERRLQVFATKFIDAHWDNIKSPVTSGLTTKDALIRSIFYDYRKALWVMLELAFLGMDKIYLEECFDHGKESDLGAVVKLGNNYVLLQNLGNNQYKIKNYTV